MIQLWLVLLGVVMAVTLIRAFNRRMHKLPMILVLTGISVVAFRLIEHLPETAPHFFVTLALFETVFSLILVVFIAGLWIVRFFMNR